MNPIAFVESDTVAVAAFPEQDDALFNKKVTPVTVPQHEIGIDLDNRVLDNIVDTMETSQFDINAINSFTQVSRSRDEIYNTLDDMGDDSIIAAVLETYAEDATETNDQGNIVWCESPDADASAFVTYLLNALNENDLELQEKHFGYYRGFEIVLPSHMLKGQAFVWIQRCGRYRVDMADNEKGNLMRIDNCIDGLKDRLSRFFDRLYEIRMRQESIESQLSKKESYLKEISACEKRLREIDKELGVKKSA